jgi:non-ribosomal peptide synthetase component F
VLQAVAGSPDIPIAQHDLVTGAERPRQLDWNHAAPQGISSQCVHDIIRAQTERTPDSVAVQVGDEALTYRQLDYRAEEIAARLRAAGAGTGTVVDQLARKMLESLRQARASTDVGGFVATAGGEVSNAVVCTRENARQLSRAPLQTATMNDAT